MDEYLYSKRLFYNSILSHDDDRVKMCVIPIGASSKIIQLRTILSNKSAGQVSRTGWAIASYSNLGTFFSLKELSPYRYSLPSARIITNLFQTKDMSMVTNLFISFILNLSIVIACTIYPNNPTQKSTDDSKQKTT